ncbi:hypothetical protein ASPZODRAFT_55956 [Penicilliopsis zonata CBS 506.65]|uniref:Sterol 3-beta-glucosyltransferase n=1 Tax=Penicilliopsis zonata CBS 506.65 TaxID=1073090 RepID=A0A1L9SW26_9EURO|nr:hypothetical protein ASPZODRAFT_55956 [Penicilliopsis zonata CBS 506.65]OJJ51389.1 hypothetical protein ASPZODRAFT_55956 [Penicilliopsis zonata CBS 506.65]
MQHDNAKRRADRRVSLTRRLRSASLMSSNPVPEPSNNGEDDDGNDDAQLDLTAPPRGNISREAQMQYMQRSIFSMIAAVGSRSDFHARFDESSESDGDTEDQPAKKVPFLETGSPSSTAASSSKSVYYDPPARQRHLTRSVFEDRGRSFRRNMLDQKSLRPLLELDRRSSKGGDGAPPADVQKAESPQSRNRSLTPRAPILSQMVEAQARFDTAKSSNTRSALPKLEYHETDGPPRPTTPSLSLRLMEMFDFEKPEKVLVEYACSLLQSMMLHGYMYVTEGHVCFYAYLPRKSSVAMKTGYLSKRGRKNPKYNRYWFSLKGDVLSYYADPSNLYFPSGHVDLRYGISASLVEPKGKGKETRDFQVTTDQRIYYFRAESSSNAQEWVKALQKVIFRTRNDGDSVKVSFPIENIIDIEESPMVDFAGTIKIRVVEAGETYALDEYFFTFFNSGNDAFDFLKSLINDVPSQLTSHSHEKSDSESTDRFRDSQGQGVSASRVSRQTGHNWAEASRRRSVSTSQLAPGHHASGTLHAFRRSSSIDSLENSVEQGAESLAVVHSMTDTAESASRILNRSDVFRSPTIHNLARGTSYTDIDRRNSDDTTRTAPVQANETRVKRGSLQGIPYATSESDQEIQDPAKAQPSASTLNDLVKVGAAYPLQRAAGIAGFLKSRSKQMSSLLATESMGYLEKVSGMWAGGGRHYGEITGPLSEDRAVDSEDNEAGCRDGDRFRAHFALPSTEKLQATYFAYLHRVLPLYGKIYIGQKKLCFRSLLPGTRTKMILPIKDIENVEKEKGFRFGYHGLVVIIRGHEELFFEFNDADTRDDCAVTLHQHLESTKFLVESGLLAQQEKEEAEAARAEHRMLQEARLGVSEGNNDTLSTFNEESCSELHPIFDDPRASIINFKPTESLRITCLTIGSRGDVQPYIALCKGLLAEGHRPKIATHAEFGPWVKKHGIDFAPVEGDPAELMRICVENGMFTYSFLKEASSKFRGWIDDLLTSSWAGCQDSDLLIESPSAMAGIHIAEALRIPYFRAFTMPWTRTRAYPHAFAVPEHKMGGAYNYITYVMFDTVFWKAIAGQVNRWRNNDLGLKATTLDKMQPNKVPFLYNYSPSVVPPPLDYPDWIRITGYWFLNEGSDWVPPAELTEFIRRARADCKKIVYIGFGSIVVSDPAALTQTVVDSVQKADVRCILSKGWSDRLGDPANTKAEVPLPPGILQIQSAPHDWLFSQIDAAAHHGGAGTTGASLRAGIPTIVKPFFGDQFFFGSRVEDLGVGICMKRLNVGVFSKALWEATHSERIITKARDLGVQIRSEDGVATAIQALYRDLEYAKTLARQRSIASATPFSPTPTTTVAEQETSGDDLADIEEWTFVDDDADADLARKVRDRGAPDLKPTASQP